ncbi:histidinol phosphatase [Subtercola sp. PAMC28395]|uniref:inositol monophosphatase family protein n=1 Tax=Subtercola sp. PAMC28395 TaxID=2846775 RepID=UPI001C0C02DA|nr:inositol monophosphatase family protein [Subtercola sp. PAMC28395]QWT23629.1 histidinol phosphatase [Subtercola sp. PAMC28395]
MTFSLSDDLALALRLADAADTISLRRFRSLDLVVDQKPDRTPVTDADRAVERAIREGLATERTGDSILGEEYGTEGESTRQWIIDPIDGTANFLRGVPVWATLIALVIDGVPSVGVVSSPALGKRWWASLGNGAWMTENSAGGSPVDSTGEGNGADPGALTVEPRRLGVSKVADLLDASISYNSLKGWDEAGHLDDLLRLSRSVWRTRAYGEMWAYMMVAEGLVDVAGEYDLQPYDVAALIPIVEEAGGVFTSIEGDPAIGSGSALATNGLLHSETVRLLKS